LTIPHMARHAPQLARCGGRSCAYALGAHNWGVLLAERFDALQIPSSSTACPRATARARLASSWEHMTMSQNWSLWNTQMNHNCFATCCFYVVSRLLITLIRKLNVGFTMFKGLSLWHMRFE